MKAIVNTKYGPPSVLRLEEVEKPAPGDGEVLVKVRAAAVNPLDWHFLRGTPLFMRFISGLLKPKARILGADIAGQVEAVGRGATRFRPGDEVYGEIFNGGFAEYVCVSEGKLLLKPTNLSFGQAAAIPVAALTALQCLRDQGKLRSGQSVLINGAAGGVGTFAVQVAKAMGADVTGVCSARNVEMVRSIGADRVVDYTSEDFTRIDRRYDLILDNVGNRSIAEIRRVLGPAGTYILNGYSPALMIRIMLRSTVSRSGGQTLRNADIAKASLPDLECIKDLVEAGKVTPVVDRTYSLGDVPEAIAYLERGHARGKVIIDVAG